jgi:hypothetical protein
MMGIWDWLKMSICYLQANLTILNIFNKTKSEKIKPPVKSRVNSDVLRAVLVYDTKFSINCVS